MAGAGRDFLPHALVRTPPCRVAPALLPLCALRVGGAQSYGFAASCRVTQQSGFTRPAGSHHLRPGAGPGPGPGWPAASRLQAFNIQTMRNLDTMEELKVNLNSNGWITVYPALGFSKHLPTLKLRFKEHTQITNY